MQERVCLWVVLALGMNACASGVEVLRHDARGGLLRSYGPTAAAAAEARLVMTEHCGGRYQLQAPTGDALEPANALALGGPVRFVCVRAIEPALPEVATPDALASAKTGGNTAP